MQKTFFTFSTFSFKKRFIIKTLVQMQFKMVFERYFASFATLFQMGRPNALNAAQ